MLLWSVSRLEAELSIFFILYPFDGDSERASTRSVPVTPGRGIDER